MAVVIVEMDITYWPSGSNLCPVLGPVDSWLADCTFLGLGGILCITVFLFVGV